ncbi:MAG: AAA family ATPase [Armatimonadota bacterium]|nr:AAA family ATPase [Armatimonadota bacterium]
MKFQHVKAEELKGPIKLEGFADWAGKLQHSPGVTSILMAAAPGKGKGSAVGSLAETLHYDIVRCRLSQLTDYPDPAGEFKAMLQGAEHLRRTVVWLDGLDRFLARLPDATVTGQQILEGWLKDERDPLSRNEVLVVATAHQASDLPAPLSGAFDQTFTG